MIMIVQIVIGCLLAHSIIAHGIVETVVFIAQLAIVLLLGAGFLGLVIIVLFRVLG